MNKTVLIACFLCGTVLPLPASAEVTATDFDTSTIVDSRMTALCHNFADEGAAYEFRIIDGRLYYTRNGVFGGEFRPEGMEHGVYVDNKTSRSTGYLDIADISLSMVAARGNRVFAYAASENWFLWAVIRTEYDRDYYRDSIVDGMITRTWFSQDATYIKTDPEESTSRTDPFFASNPDHFYTMNAIRNDMLLDTIPELNRLGLKLGGRVPDLYGLSTKRDAVGSVYDDFQGKVGGVSLPPGPLWSNIMHVSAPQRVWQVLDGMSPGNNTDKALYQDCGSVEEQKRAMYEINKRRVFHELSGLATKVMAELLSTPPPDTTFVTNDEALRTTLGGLVKQVVDSMQNSQKINFIKLNTVQLADNIRRINVKSLIDAMLEFYDRNIDYALLHYADMGLPADADPYTAYDLQRSNSPEKCREIIATRYFNNTVSSLKNEVWSSLSGTGSNLGIYDLLVSLKIRQWSNLLVDRYVSEFVNYRAERFVPDAGPDYLSPDNLPGRWVQIARGLHNWYNHYTEPSRYFLMKDTLLPPEPYRGELRSHIDIKEVLDIGVNAISRYEHYRFHFGGEYGAFYGKYRKRDSFVRSALFLDGKQTAPRRLVDNHCYNDGTVNFYMLAKIGIKDSLGNTSVVPAVLWIDEQEYFSERWRVVDPRDNAFEGLGGVISGGVSVLYWFNGVDPHSFCKSFYTPYRQLTSDARMATAGTAIVVAGKDTIYSTSQHWSVTDASWRWRTYPKLAPGEYIDKKTLRLRDDMTICFYGIKRFGDTFMKGYWYQNYLGPDYEFKGKTVYGGKPAEGYAHSWNFMEKSAFEYAERHFHKMGLYDTMSGSSTYSGQHYAYRGYSPHTNILALGADAVLSSNLQQRSALQIASGEQQTFRVSDIMQKSTSSNATAMNEFYVLNDDGSRMYHPMYTQMTMDLRQPIKIRFTAADSLYYACFTDPRNDDLDLSHVPFKIQPVGDTSGFWYRIDSDQFSNLNVWADIPVSYVQLSYDPAREALLCRIFLAGAEKFGSYLISSVNIACIRNGSAEYLARHYFKPPLLTMVEEKLPGYALLRRDRAKSTSRIPESSIPKRHAAAIRANVVTSAKRFSEAPQTASLLQRGEVKPRNYFSFTFDNISREVWSTYFSNYGRALYGTSIWVEDLFGNGNSACHYEVLKGPLP